MRPLATISAAILMALPLSAAEQKPAAAPAATAQAAASDRAAGSAPVQLSVDAKATEVSPLVAAARSTNRASKKPRIVITNETLAGKNAHVTTAASQPPVPILPPRTSSDWDTLEAIQAAAKVQAVKDREAAAKKAAAEAAHKRREAALAARSEDDSLNPETDPAEIEHQIETQSTPQTQPAPPPQKPQKP